MTEKVLHLKALGAEVHMTRSDVGQGHPAYYQDYAERMAQRDRRRVLHQPVQQPGQPAGARDHDRPGDLGSRCGHGLDAIVCGVGSAGTITGLTRFFKRVQPQLEFVLADPVGSVLADYIAHRHASARPARGWSRASARTSFRRSPTSRASSTPTRSPTSKASPPRAICSSRRHPGGSSSGTLVAAALRYCREQTAPKRVVTFVCDSGTSISQDVQRPLDGRPGPSRSAAYGDLRDLIARRFEDGGVVSVGPQDTLLTAFQRMRLYDVSQLPVLDGGALVGMLDESDLLLQRAGRRRALSRSRCAAR